MPVDVENEYLVHRGIIDLQMIIHQLKDFVEPETLEKIQAAMEALKNEVSESAD